SYDLALGGVLLRRGVGRPLARGGQFAAAPAVAVGQRRGFGGGLLRAAGAAGQREGRGRRQQRQGARPGCPQARHGAALSPIACASWCTASEYIGEWL